MSDATDECAFCHHRRDAHARPGAHNSGRGCAHCDCSNFDHPDEADIALVLKAVPNGWAKFAGEWVRAVPR